MSSLRSQIASLRMAAGQALERSGNRLSITKARALDRVQPVLSPWIEKAAHQLRWRPAPVAPTAVRVALIEYFRAVVQTSGAVAESASSQRIPEGMLHLSRLVERRLIQIHNLKAFDSTDDPVEAVHQLRVASRRLRAFVDMFGPLIPPELVKAAQRPLRQLTRAVRDLRDADVQSASLRQRVRRATSEAERIALNHLLERTCSFRQKQAVLARKRLGSIDFSGMADALRKMLDQLALRAQSPSVDFGLLARVAFEPVLEEARRKSPTGSSPPDVEVLHEFRLTLKKLRYAAELIEPELGEHYEEVHRHAKRLQTVLGEHQDSVEFQKLVERRYEKAVRRRRLVLSAGLKTVLERAVQERKECYARCADACQKTTAPRLFAVAAHFG